MKIGIYLYDQAEVLDFAGPFEVFSTASRVSGQPDLLQPLLISVSGDAVTARAGFRMQPDFSIADHPPDPPIR